MRAQEYIYTYYNTIRQLYNIQLKEQILLQVDIYNNNI